MEVNENRHKTADLLERLLKGESLVYETTHFRKDGTHFQLEVSAKAIPIADEYYIQSFLRDITEKKKIQAHLFQSQKMESIGMLAGGIAHDFNNILTAILGYTVVIRKEVGANEKVLGKLTIIENAARKAGRLVSQLLGFSRKSELERVTVHMNDIVQDTVKLLERAIDKRIEMKLDLEPGLPPVEGDYNQLEQAIMNFVVNARDAMPYGGVITIATASKYIEPGMPDIPPYIPTGRYVIVKVQDTGVGIPEEIQQKIFEPFFTTKERGKGTGLGLAMVYGVITEHKGFLTVQSKVNEGTTFTVFLPVSVKAVVPAARKAVPLAARGTETVLVVDDEEDALSNMQETLEQGGYKVIATTNPLQALEAYKKMHSEISLVIIDIVMPLIDGRGLMKQIIDVDPAARFLTVSGFSRYAEQPDDVKPDMFLPKPFDPAELLAAVRRILDRGKALHAL
jgi:signal transduction histidine kinase/CheY-like chemotaxis protein